ncbi:unnamed protein product, partial [Brenthis ino]
MTWSNTAPKDAPEPKPTLSPVCNPAKDRFNEWEHTDRIIVEELPPLQAVSECGSTSNDEGNQKVKSYKIKRGTIERKCKEHWKDIKRKKLTNSGQPYISKSGKFRRGKQIGPACPTTCKLKCYAKFNDTIRKSIHKEFWNLSDHCKHWKYINEYVEKTNKKRMTTESSRRQYTMKYYLPLPVDENTKSYERVRVCSRIFNNTLSISDRFVRTALNKLSCGTLTDNRGKHNNHRIAIDESMIESVCDHVSSFELIKSRCKYYLSMLSSEDSEENGLVSIGGIIAEELPYLTTFSESSPNIDEYSRRIKPQKPSLLDKKRNRPENQWIDTRRKMLVNSGQSYVSRNGGPSRRKYTTKYFLPLPTEDDPLSYKRVQVCLKFFINTLSTSYKVVRTAVSKLDSECITLTDNRAEWTTSKRGKSMIKCDGYTFSRRPGLGKALHEDDVLNDILQNGNFSEIEVSDQDDLDFKPNNLFNQIEDHLNDEEHDFQTMVERPSFKSVVQLSPGTRTRDNSHQKKPVSAFTTKKKLSTPNSKRKRIWKQVPFENKQHYYTSLPTKPVRRPIDYFRDYFDDAFLEKVSYCTNLYYFRTNGIELKCTSSEIAKLFAIHMIMGCIPYPRLSMYWKAGTKLGLISDLMPRDRFLTIRNALHVIETDLPLDHEKENPLWKVQPMINKVKDTCNRLERSPGFYSIDKKIIPFSGRCKLRQMVKHKVIGLKNFVLTTSEGLILDFAIYKDEKFFGETNLGLGPAIILHLTKSVPSGSCIYFDRYFTTIPLIEEMEKLNLHATGTIMQNRISNQTTIKFNKDSNMDCGGSEQFVCEPITVVKWKDNKSVILASNCTGVDETINVKRWDKFNKRLFDKITKQYHHVDNVGTKINNDIIEASYIYFTAPYLDLGLGPGIKS